ncbi:hypothetical protein PQG02_13905 [Nostoc sp. UHCC 0926]|uniref:hypothetical protein n=1 Tax=Nostoc sp. TaxID=1180 RepID=UPI0027A15707|nr:hypothetical protein PQG02_13905 [Nostoc sp. UHCC 0926]
MSCKPIKTIIQIVSDYLLFQANSENIRKLNTALFLFSSYGISKTFAKHFGAAISVISASYASHRRIERRHTFIVILPFWLRT